MFLNKPFSVRLSKECLKTVRELQKDYPDNYPTEASVVRAGVFALKRWRNENE